MHEASKYLDTSLCHSKAEEQVDIFTRSCLLHEVIWVEEPPAIADCDRICAELQPSPMLSNPCRDPRSLSPKVPARRM
jgi:hypothetical protein